MGIGLPCGTDGIVQINTTDIEELLQTAKS